MRPSEQVRDLATRVFGATTDDLLHELLANLAVLLGARRVYVTEMVDEEISRTIASWEDEKRGPQRVYGISGTPCAEVMRSGVYVVERELGARHTFGESSLGFGFESFIGGPIVDRHGTTIGQLCAFSDEPVDDAGMASALISLAAVRVSAELDHRQQQDLLLRQRQQLELLLGNLPGMAYRCDYDPLRTMRFVSQGCAALTGYDREQLVGGSHHWAGLMHEDDRDRVWSEVQSALSAGSNFEVRYRILTKDGKQKWAWERGCGVTDENGRISMLEGFVSDVTALKESEDALARSEAYSTAIVATAADGIVTLDAKGRIGSVNQAAERMFGFNATELLGQDVCMLMPEPYRSEHGSFIQRYIATGEARVIGKASEVVARHKNGSTFPIQLAVSEVPTDGELCFAGIIRDISDQKAAEESLQKIERRFRAIFDQRLQLVGVLSTDGIILEANQKSLDFTGLQCDEVIGRYFWDTPWWQHSENLQQRLRDAIASAAEGATTQFEATCPRSDGSMAAVEFSLRPITDRAGQVVFLVSESHDITEQRLAEEEARHHREQIAHVSRLSTLGEMAAGIAHEINQPLTAISLFAQAGKRLVEAGNFEKMDEVLNKLNEHALRASAVLDRMQAMARRGETVKEVADCNAVIESAVKLAESEARIHDIQIEFAKDENLPPVFIDAVQVQQVALNLLRNGMEAMADVDQRQGRSVIIQVRVRDEENIEVAVIDAGLGVPEQNVDKLFTPFSTTKKSGMGMGLSISQAIVRAHGGQLDFHNNDSGGATFWFTLPVVNREIQDG